MQSQGEYSSVENLFHQHQTGFHIDTSGRANITVFQWLWTVSNISHCPVYHCLFVVLWNASKKQWTLYTNRHVWFAAINTFAVKQIFAWVLASSEDLLLPRYQQDVCCSAGVRLSYMYWIMSILVSGSKIQSINQSINQSTEDPMFQLL